MSDKSRAAYELYLDKYAKKTNISREEAEKHVMVKNVKEYYESCKNVVQDGVPTKSVPIECGCCK